MRFTEQQMVQAQWMLDNQIHSPYELFALWMLFPQSTGPEPEVCTPWFAGLEHEVSRVN